MNRTNILEVKELHKSFGEVEVLKGIDFSLRKGEIVSIVGPLEVENQLF